MLKLCLFCGLIFAAQIAPASENDRNLSREEKYVLNADHLVICTNLPLLTVDFVEMFIKKAFDEAIFDTILINPPAQPEPPANTVYMFASDNKPGQDIFYCTIDHGVHEGENPGLERLGHFVNIVQGTPSNGPYDISGLLKGDVFTGSGWVKSGDKNIHVFVSKEDDPWRSFSALTRFFSLPHNHCHPPSKCIE